MEYETVSGNITQKSGIDDIPLDALLKMTKEAIHEANLNNPYLQLTNENLPAKASTIKKDKSKNSDIFLFLTLGAFAVVIVVASFILLSIY